MLFKIIYEPRGRAREYAELALNIYNGCSMGCLYCYAPEVLRRDRNDFRENIQLRENLLKKLENDCQKDLLCDRKVLLCFTCDPYQYLDYVLSMTRSVLELFKKYNINFIILTKAGRLAERDFDLYKPGDSFGCTLTFWNAWESAEWEPNAALPISRLEALQNAHSLGIKTWVSMEPVIDPQQTYKLIEESYPFVDLYKIGKLNTDNCRGNEHYEALRQIEQSIDWKAFGERAEALLKQYSKEYYIKEDLRKECQK